MPISRSEVLRLYKNLMIYSKSLTLTDSTYFKRRISSEFRKNKDLTKAEDIKFAYQTFSKTITEYIQKGEELLKRGAVL